MKIDARLRVSLLHTAAIVAAASALWIFEVLRLPDTGFALKGLLGPVLAAAFISMVVSLLPWIQPKDRLRQALRLPEEFRARTGLALRIAVRLLRAGAWLSILMSAGLSLAGTRPDPGTYYNLIGGLTGIFVFVAVVRASSVRFPVASHIFPVPWVRLIAFVIVYVILHAGWLTEHGFPNRDLQIALWVALAASYAGGRLGGTAQMMGQSNERRWWIPPLAVVKGAGTLLAGLSGGLFVWGALGSLPNVSALLLSRWPHLLIGYATQPHFGQLYEARHLAGLFAAGLYFVIRLPAGARDSGWTDYMPLSKAVGYSTVGAVVWLMGAEIAELGHGFPLLGAAVACGFFAAGLSFMARYYTSNPVWAVNAVAQLLAKSVYRTAFLGAFLALYGLLVRPLVYDVMWFAPIYEWMAVVLFAAIAINRMRSHARQQVLPEGGTPAEWPHWSRHVQTVEERRDLRLDGLLDLQRQYVETGRWGYLWRYMLGLLLRNRTPLEEIPAVFEPMRRSLETSTAWDPWPRKRVRAMRRRSSALAESLSRMDAALKRSPEPLPEIDEERVREMSRPFVEDCSQPETLAVTLAAAYWQRGAPLDLAVALWFPVLTITDGGRGGLFSLLRSREGVDQGQKERRTRIIDAALSHLFGDGKAGELPLAVLAAPAPVYHRLGRYFASHIPQGEAIEVLSEEGANWRVRAGDDQQSCTTPAGAARRRILPGD